VELYVKLATYWMWHCKDVARKAYGNLSGMVELRII